ncbi:MAG: type VI secretion system contractile sheath large subunit [Planctomycetota bacterium]|jgi:type VI secretion system protein ImpC|nr:MAG: type VI secretion system contractile sheath large subunit [Planctomycetota bacterium]
MSSAKKDHASADVASHAEASKGSLLDQITSQMPRAVEKPRRDELIHALVEHAVQGTMKFDKNVTKTVTAAIAQIDAAMSQQLAAIMHHPSFQALEGSWRGLQHLIMSSETGASLKIRVMNATKREVFKDLDKAVEFDQSQIFKKVYEAEFGSPGGEPYGALIGDYQFTNHPEDIDLLTKMSQVSAAGFCPFVTAAGPELLGMDSFDELSKPRDLEKIFLDTSYAKWRSFRDSEDSRFVVLTMPRTLARLPYGQSTKPVEEFQYEEVALGQRGESIKVDHSNYCWMNTAYVFGTRLTDSFAQTGWCTSIRGVENGGKVEGLPAHVFTGDDGDQDLKCPTEIAITDRREAELSKLGFLPLCHFKNTDYAVFFGSQTAQKAKKYDRPEATANAAISTRLPYVMATARIAHFLKCIARDKIGSFMQRADCEDWLQRWLNNYVTASQNPSAEVKASHPLAEGKVKVEEIPGSPGSYNAVAWLRPWLQMEELTSSMRLVAKIPAAAGKS